MSVNPWARHFQLPWEERAGDSRLPLWMRVVCLAFGRHRSNGHAPFAPGQVALVLSTVDPDSGEIHAPSRQEVYRAIRAAVSYGFLAEGSSARCLQVPAHAVTGGMGSHRAPCSYHDRKRS